MRALGLSAGRREVPLVPARQGELPTRGARPASEHPFWMSRRGWSVLPDARSFFQRPFRCFTGIHVVVRGHEADVGVASGRAVVYFAGAGGFRFGDEAGLAGVELDSAGRAVRARLFVDARDRTGDHDRGFARPERL